jgi:bacterioferritin (cytochrome b1)
MESNRAKTIRLLNGALGIARAGVLRAEQQYCVAYRHHSPAVAAAALERANEAWHHADRIVKRITDLGGQAELPATPSPEKGPSAEAHGRPLPVIMSADLAAQRASIKTYRKIAMYCQALDHKSQKLIEDIIAAEEASSFTLAGLLEQPSAATP